MQVLPKKNSNLGLWYITLLKKNLVHNFGILTQNFGTLTQKTFILWYNIWVLIPKKKIKFGLLVHLGERLFASAKREPR